MNKVKTILYAEINKLKDILELNLQYDPIL
jgi:hypothetical protein